MVPQKYTDSGARPDTLTIPETEQIRVALAAVWGVGVVGTRTGETVCATLPTALRPRALAPYKIPIA